MIRANDTTDLESAINHFLGEELQEIGDVQLEEITQSEGPGGVTVMLWYSLVEEAEESEDEYEGERTAGELA